jgi:hypothetical protein
VIAVAKPSSWRVGGKCIRGHRSWIEGAVELVEHSLPSRTRPLLAGMGLRGSLQTLVWQPDE